MIARLSALWLRIKNSLWALPLSIAAGCALLALVAINLDLPGTSEVGWLYAGTSEQAPDFAASLVSALITLTALAFSITMVVLTLAAQQLGPRLISIFMGDRGTQVALGLFIGTVVYLLVVLRSLDGQSSSGAPALAITGGTALVLASIVTLLLFVHSLARSIVSDHVIARVGEMLDHAIERNFVAEPTPPAFPPPVMPTSITLEARGYVQQINYEGLARDLKKCGATMHLTYHAGCHMICREVDARGRGADADHLKRLLKRAVVIGHERTPGQDPHWSVRQLVEIALRALSPGINDEFTAIVVLDRLTLALSILLQRYARTGAWCDDEGEPRVFGPTPTIAMMMDAALDQIRDAGRDKAAIMGRLAENLTKLSRSCAEAHRDVVASHVAKLKAALARSDLPEHAKIEINEVLARARPMSPFKRAPADQLR